MEVKILDVTPLRCPMSLLVAKRAAQGLGQNEKLEIKIVDQSSLADMIKYFQLNGYQTHLIVQPLYTLLTVTMR